MRLYSIYFLCKTYREKIYKCDIVERTTNNGAIIEWRDWSEYQKIIAILLKVNCLKEGVESIYEEIPVLEREKDIPVISRRTWDRIHSRQSQLSSQMGIIINLYESMGLKEESDVEGIDVKIPKCDSFEEYINLLKDIQFVFEYCPFLKAEDTSIEFDCVDVGSQWLSFIITAGASSAAVAYIFGNLAQMLDKAIQLRSHMKSLKEQEETARRRKLSNDFLETLVNGHKVLMEHYVAESIEKIEEQSPENKITDNEERTKAEKSLEKITELMEKGVEIYTSIDTDKDIQLLFPPLEKQEALSDDLIKLLEDKNTEENN